MSRETLCEAFAAQDKVYQGEIVKVSSNLKTTAK